MATRKEIERALRHLAPKLPDHEFGAIADHAMDRPVLHNATPETAAWLSLVSYVRHVFTDYDSLLDDGYDPESARYFVASDIEAVLKEWGVKRGLNSGE